MEPRSNPFNEMASKLLFLIPNIIKKKGNVDGINFQKTIDFYKYDLLSGYHWKEEVTYFGRDSQIPTNGKRQKNVRVSTLTKTFKICNKITFPNLFTLINIAATLPVTSYKREQSFSLIRRFRTWIRASMIHERFSSLAFMYIH